MTDKGAEAIAAAIRSLANAVTPVGAGPAHDAMGGYVGSLTEAVLGITSALATIGHELSAIREHMERGEG